ncbi:hypothetical protein GCM10020219_089710 [Nonomuraea dietziae]
MKSFEIGVVLPGIAVQRRDGIDLRAAALHAENAGLDGVWHGDHLAVGGPTLDAPIALAIAAAATTRIRIGTSVFVPAIRPVVWAAKQIATLQYVSGGRLVLGVGSGGGRPRSGPQRGCPTASGAAAPTRPWSCFPTCSWARRRGCETKRGSRLSNWRLPWRCRRCGSATPPARRSGGRRGWATAGSPP